MRAGLGEVGKISQTGEKGNELTIKSCFLSFKFWVLSWGLGQGTFDRMTGWSGFIIE
jgi:hypothetical protein